MPTSIVNSYAQVSAKSVAIEKDIISHHDDGSTKTTLRFVNNTADRTVSIPAVSANASLLTSESNIVAEKLNINGATAVASPTSVDELVIYDQSASANRKITFANLKSAIDTTLDIDGMTAQTVAGIDSANDVLVVRDDSADDNKKITVANLNAVNYAGISNHATVSSAGALSLSSSGKNAALDAMSGHATSSSGAITISATGKGAVLSLMSADATCSTAGAVALADKPSAKKTAEANKFLHCDASKDVDGINALGCASLTASADMSAANCTVSGEFRLGTNKWKIAQSGNNLQFLEYNGSAYVVKFQIAGSGQS